MKRASEACKAMLALGLCLRPGQGYHDSLAAAQDYEPCNKNPSADPPLGPLMDPPRIT